MIIGINGVIGSGKDTVGSIIQYLKTPKDKISYTGSYNSFVIDKDFGYSNYSKWEIKKFAGKLKQIASLMTGIPVEKFEDQEFKKTYLGEEWSYESTGQERLMTVREFLQRLGTESIRNNLHPNTWVNALFADYKPKNLSKNWNNADEKLWIQQRYGVYKHDAPDGIFHYQEYPNWIITDTRFPNEAQSIKDRGGIVIRVNRNTSQKGISWDIFKCADHIYEVQRIDEANLLESDDEARDLAIKEGYEFKDSYNIYKVTKFPTKHPSETELDHWNFDYIIENNEGIDELIEKVDKMLEHFNI